MHSDKDQQEQQRERGREMGLHLEFHVQSVSHRNMFMISKSYSTFDHVGDQRI